MRKSILDELFNEINDSAELIRIETKMLLAQKIDMGMRAKGWKKSQFAREMGQKPSVITRWLSGTNNFNTDTLIDIEDKLGIKLLNTQINDVKIVGHCEVSSISTQHNKELSVLFHNSRLLSSSNSNTYIN